NQFYNKRHAKLQARLPAVRFTFRALDELTDDWTRAIPSSLHTASQVIIDLLVFHGIGTLVSGKHEGWKQQVKLGKPSNQQFVVIRHAGFMQTLIYKSERVGIQVMLNEERYTSKCGFPDLEPMGKREMYLGTWVKHGWFRSSTGRGIHTSVNGSYNLLCKAFPRALFQGITECHIHPTILSLPDRRQVRHMPSRALQATG